MSAKRRGPSSRALEADTKRRRSLPPWQHGRGEWVVAGRGACARWACLHWAGGRWGCARARKGRCAWMRSWGLQPGERGGRARRSYPGAASMCFAAMVRGQGCSPGEACRLERAGGTAIRQVWPAPRQEGQGCGRARGIDDRISSKHMSPGHGLGRVGGLMSHVQGLAPPSPIRHDIACASARIDIDASSSVCVVYSCGRE